MDNGETHSAKRTSVVATALLWSRGFKVKKWVGLGGFIITFTVMSQLNVLAMIVAIVIIGGIFYYLSRRQIALGTGDIWQSVWATIVKKGLKRMEAKQDHKRNWKPNTLLFSTGTQNRSKMIEFSKASRCAAISLKSLMPKAAPAALVARVYFAPSTTARTTSTEPSSV